MARKRSEADEKMLKAIAATNPNDGSTTLYILGMQSGAINCDQDLDARPRANAVANQAMGSGYEFSSRYENTDLQFMDIGNIHVMRESMAKLCDLCQQAAAYGT